MKDIAFKFNSDEKKKPDLRVRNAGCCRLRQEKSVCLSFNPNNPVNCGTENFFLSCDNDGFVTRLSVRVAFLFFFFLAPTPKVPELWLRTQC
jgi:hypothetical protein